MTAYFGRRSRWSKNGELEMVRNVRTHYSVMEKISSIVGIRTADAWKADRILNDRLAMVEITDCAERWLDELTNEQ